MNQNKPLRDLSEPAKIWRWIRINHWEIYLNQRNNLEMNQNKPLRDLSEPVKIRLFSETNMYLTCWKFVSFGSLLIITVKCLFPVERWRVNCMQCYDVCDAWCDVCLSKLQRRCYLLTNSGITLCDTVGELIWGFAFVFALVRFSKSRHRLFILS